MHCSLQVQVYVTAFWSLKHIYYKLCACHEIHFVCVWKMLVKQTLKSHLVLNKVLWLSYKLSVGKSLVILNHPHEFIVKTCMGRFMDRGFFRLMWLVLISLHVYGIHFVVPYSLSVYMCWVNTAHASFVMAWNYQWGRPHMLCQQVLMKYTLYIVTLNSLIVEHLLSH